MCIRDRVIAEQDLDLALDRFAEVMAEISARRVRPVGDTDLALAQP